MAEYDQNDQLSEEDRLAKKSILELLLHVLDLLWSRNV